MKVLVTGAAGYVGSHTILELLKAGYSVVAVDNLNNSSDIVFERIRQISGVEVPFHLVDITDEHGLGQVFSKYQFDGVLHFAALKSVSDSFVKPIDYYKVNVGGSAVLMSLMERWGCYNYVFSSSATVYGATDERPLREDAPLAPVNIYGSTKVIGEDLALAAYQSSEKLSIAVLRYFNPVGADRSGLIGEDPRGEIANLMPLVAQVALGQRESLSVYGNDYPTSDGTGVRDYVHVADIAKAHVKALQHIAKARSHVTLNLGTQKGSSVLDLISTFEDVSQRKISFSFADRRPGDVAVCLADSSQAGAILDWTPTYDLRRMCEDTWRWVRLNPDGYQ